MRLLSLGARHLRNLDEFRIEPHPRFNIITGRNAQGKTNLLEAVFVLGSLKSFRTSTHRDMVRFDHDTAVIVSRIERDGLERDVRIELDPRRRKVQVNGQYVRRLADYLGSVQAVLFAPEDVTLLKGSPSDRRTFVDRAVFNSRAASLEELNEHGKVLKQRNTVLRDERPSHDLLDIFTEQIVATGARVAASRLDYLHQLAPFFRESFGEIFGAGLEVGLAIDPSWLDEPIELGDAPPPSADAIAELMTASFARRRGEELRRGTTVLGPHRDDLLVRLDGRPAKQHASQGQHRALVLALKVSEIRLLRERFHVEPVLLLDDVSSELDATRNGQLFDFLGGFEGQVFITTTHERYIRLAEEHGRRTWSIETGALTLVGG